MVTTFYPPYNFGGDGLFIQQLARDLVNDGHEVHVIHCGDAYQLRAQAPPTMEAGRDGVRVHTLLSRLGSLSPIVTQLTGRPGLKGRALRRLLDTGFDVINYHNISLIGGPAVLKLGGGIKLLTLHEHWWVCPTHVLWKYTGELCTQPSCLRCCLANRTPPQAWRLARRWRARCLANVDVVLAASRFTADRHATWMAQHGVRTPVEVCPLYVPALKARPLPPGALPPRYFLFVGRVLSEKGIDLVLEAFAKRPDYALVVVGDRSCHAGASASTLANVHWAGKVAREDVGTYYASALALVFPSLCAETFGLTPVEAFSLGTPVIGRPAGGAEDIMEGAGAVPFDTLQELVEALDRMWAHEDERQQIGIEARARYRAQYTWAAYRRRYYDTIERAGAARHDVTRTT
jgi:glycosyltransferase involved in cell wall biosynthesis